MLQLVTSAAGPAPGSPALGGTPPVQASEVAQTNVISIAAVRRAPATAALVANTYAPRLRHHPAELGPEERDRRGDAAAQPDPGDRRQIAGLLKSSGSASELNSLVNQRRAPGPALPDPGQRGGGDQRSGPGQPGASGHLAQLAQAGHRWPAWPGSRADPGPGRGVLRDSLDDAVSSKEAAEHLAGAPVLAAVPMVTSWRKRDRPLW